MRLPALLSDVLGAMRSRLVNVAQSFREQLDKSGLFPDLADDEGSRLRRAVQADGEITKLYMLMCGLAAGITALGLLQSSSAVVIGAMLISPLMGPVASMGFGFASLDGKQIRDSAKVVAIGAAIVILVSVLLTWISPIRNATPEIIARTEPTLLDLAIAALSGAAGAFATVWQRGVTAIGVAISLALMPPLAVFGYALGVANFAFMGAALLLFLTNLAVITFSFALVARASGAARPIANVEVNPHFVFIGIYAFLILASPLALQLYRVTREANAFALTRRTLQEELHVGRPNIAQLAVKWPIRGEPEIDAVLITPVYRKDAERLVSKRLTSDLGTEPQVRIQQVVASNPLSQARAIVDTAVERTVTGIARDLPPLAAIRARLGIPIQALWTIRPERTVQLVPVSAPGWSLADYRALESRATDVGKGWKVNIIPPAPASLVVPIKVEDDVRSAEGQLDLAVWAITRWGLATVGVAGFSKRNANDADRKAAEANAAFVAEALIRHGIASKTAIIEPRSGRLRNARAEAQAADGVEIRIVSPAEDLAGEQSAPAAPER